MCLTLDRATFTAVLGPLQQLMSREKSAAVVTQRLMKLQSRGGPSRVPAEVLVRRRRRSKSKGTDVWEVIRARGHLDEVLELRKTNSSRNLKPSSDGSGGNGAAAAAGGGDADGGGAVAQLVLTEGNVLGGGAFSRVSIVTEQTTGRTYALKRMRKSAVVQCPEHVFCEQTITRNLTHPFCIRQYASFQVGWQWCGFEPGLVRVRRLPSGLCRSSTPGTGYLPMAGPTSAAAVAQQRRGPPLKAASQHCRVLKLHRIPMLPLQDKYHLYFLFDLMSGGDLMDVLVADAQVGGALSRSDGGWEHSKLLWLSLLPAWHGRVPAFLGALPLVFPCCLQPSAWPCCAGHQSAGGAGGAEARLLCTAGASKY